MEHGDELACKYCNSTLAYSVGHNWHSCDCGALKIPDEHLIDCYGEPQEADYDITD